MIHAPQLLVLVRHGKSSRNAAQAHSPIHFKNDEVRRGLAGIPDHHVPLIEEGDRHALFTGPVIRSRFGCFDTAYHSGYERTKRTLTQILEAYPPHERSGVVLKQSIRLRERESGYTFDMTKDEAEQHFPWMAEYWKSTGPLFARPVGGESVAQVIDRVEPFLDKLMREETGKKVLVSLHGRVLTALRFLLEDWTYETAEQFLKSRGDDSPKNCGITVYRPDPRTGRLVLDEYNTVCGSESA